MAGATRLKYSTNSRPRKKIKFNLKIEKKTKKINRTNVKLTIPVRKAM